MNQLAAPFKQLLERRLWPLAVLLVAALVAVPVLLAADEPAGAPPAGATTEQGLTQPIASVADPAATELRRRVLGAPKNPFRPSLKATPTPTAESVTAASSGATASGGGEVKDAGGSAAPSGGSGAPAPVAPQPVAPVPTPAPEVHELHSLEVRFGPSTGPLERRNLKRLTGLPGGRRPAVMYLGLKADRRTAVFLVDATAKIQGDGRCDPGPENCQTLTMRPGDTVFIDTAGGNQYELDLLKVHTSRTTDAAKAAAARTAEARGGRAYLRRNVERVGRYRYSPSAGVLRTVSRQAAEAAAARRADDAAGE